MKFNKSAFAFVTCLSLCTLGICSNLANDSNSDFTIIYKAFKERLSLSQFELPTKSSESAELKEEESDKIDSEKFKNVYVFLLGFLEGMQVAGAEIDIFLQCVANLPEFKNSLQETLHKFTELDFKKKKADILKAFIILFELFNKLYEEFLIMKEVPKEIKELLEVYAGLSFTEILEIVKPNFLFHSGRIITDITRAGDALKSRDFYTLGRLLGDFIYVVFKYTPQ